MRRPGTFKIGALRGIEFNIHYSLVFLLLYVVFVATVQFPFTVQQSGVEISQLRGSPVAWAFIFAGALFMSVALHEFGHAFAAQAQGIKVRGITLMMLGGVSEMDKIPERPYAEFKLAIIGPLVSLAIWGILALIGHTTRSPNLAFFCYWLGSANLVLAIFNLIPAFPLDGGRALRSFLAARQGPLKATQISVKLSKFFAWTLGILGLLNFNFFLVLIALFVYSAAQTELFFLLARGALKGLRVGEVMTPLETIFDTMSLKDTVALMLKTRSRILPVETASDAQALVSLEAITRVPRDAWPTTPVRDIMEEAPKVVDVNESINAILASLAAAPYQVLPVRNERTIVGIIKYSDLAEILQFKSLETQDKEEKKAA